MTVGSGKTPVSSDMLRTAVKHRCYFDILYVLCQEVQFCISKPRRLNKGCHRSAELQQRQAVPVFYPLLVTKDVLFQRCSPINNSFNISLSLDKVLSQGVYKQHYFVIVSSISGLICISGDNPYKYQVHSFLLFVK